MKVNIVDVKKVVDVNELKEVTDPVYFQKGFYPNPNSLFSYEIFGRPGSDDRKFTFAYIDLHAQFLHPVVYKTLLRVNRKFEDCVAGRKYFVLDGVNGEIKEVDDESVAGAGTGLSFLYNNWDKIKWRMSESTQRKERITFLKSLKRNEAFSQYQLVIPAFYRDVNFQDVAKGIVAHDVINDLYSKLLRQSSALAENSSDLTGMSFMADITKFSIQMTLLAIYDYCTSKIKGKNGLFRQAVLGKNVDYAARLVISAADFGYNRHDELPVNFTHSGLPLAQCLTTFFPFIVKWIMDWAKEEFKDTYPIRYKNKEGKFEVERITLKDVDEVFSYDGIVKKMNQFSKALEERFEVITVEMDEKGKALMGKPRADLYLQGYFMNTEKYELSDQQLSDDSTEFSRPMTWTDLFYRAAVEVTKDKHIYITRYPVEDYLAIYPSRITVISTFDTKRAFISGKTYDRYPVIDLSTPKEKIPGLFVDTLQISNAMLSALGGDFDGDQVTVRGVFSQEANKEAEEIMNSKKNILSITGRNVRDISNEGIQGLYNLTKKLV